MREMMQQGAKQFQANKDAVTQYARDPNGEGSPTSDDDDDGPSSGDRRDDRPESDRSSDEDAVKSWEDPEKGWSRKGI